MKIKIALIILVLVSIFVVFSTNSQPTSFANSNLDYSSLDLNSYFPSAAATVYANCHSQCVEVVLGPGQYDEHCHFMGYSVNTACYELDGECHMTECF